MEESLIGGQLIPSLAELDPQSFNLQYLLATTHLQQGKHNQALSSFSKLLELKPDFIQAHLQKAKILSKEGNFEAAKAEVQEFLKGMKGKAGDDTKLAKDKEDATELVRALFLLLEIT
jgi:tetratricopeptide (TPR) repeat protein